MNQHVMPLGKVEIEPTKRNQWRIEGPCGAFRITLSDSGGWDITGDGRKDEHHVMLHHALFRVYNLAIGVVT